MTVVVSKEGLKNSNKLFRKVEPILSVSKLKQDYLYGISLTDPKTNRDISDKTLENYIVRAVSFLEHDLDILVSPEEVTEYRDFYNNDYTDWGFMQVNNFPLYEITSIDLIYQREDDGTEKIVYTIPDSWIRIEAHSGIIRLIPNSNFPGNIMLDNTGSYFPEVLRSSQAPHLWKIQYKAGFQSGCVPSLMNQAVGLQAGIMALISLGPLVLGAGIASQSIGIDGLSSSINSTQSAENSSHSAQIKEYQRLLFGSTKDDPTAILKVLRHYYRGQEMAIL